MEIVVFGNAEEGLIAATSGIGGTSSSSQQNKIGEKNTTSRTQRSAEEKGQRGFIAIVD